MQYVIDVTRGGYCYVKRILWGDEKIVVQRASNWRTLEQEAKQAVISKMGAFRPPHNWLSCPPALAEKARWPEASIADREQERGQACSRGREAGKVYAAAHPVSDWAEYRIAKREADKESARLADLLRDSAEAALLPHSFDTHFRVGFGEGYWHTWREQLKSLGKLRSSQRQGEISIIPIKLFGRWRVQVCKAGPIGKFMLRKQIEADNWQELEPQARAFLLARYGTVETGRAPCPRSIARRARWLMWEAKNLQKSEGG